MKPRIREDETNEAGPRAKPITRRVLLSAVPATLTVVGVQSAAAEPLDGKGNDVCPCFFDVDGVELMDDETISVAGPCGVANPPEAVTVRAHVRGERGARATGSETVVCEGTADDRDRFSLVASVRGVNRFVQGDTVVVHAQVHVGSDDAPTVTGRWSWSGELS